MQNKAKMTAAAASRIQSATAKASNGNVQKGSFAARAQAASAANQQPNWPSKVPNQDSGGGRTNNPPRK